MQNLPKVICPQSFPSTPTTEGLSCASCKLSFISPKDLALHLSKLDDSNFTSDEFQNPLQCEKCLKTFESYQGLRQHQGKVHSPLKKAKCKFCKKRFKNTYAVKYHRLQVHEKRNRVECYLCGKVLYNQFNFKNHLKKCQDRFFGDKARFAVDGEKSEVDYKSLI